MPTTYQIVRQKSTGLYFRVAPDGTMSPAQPDDLRELGVGAQGPPPGPPAQPAPPTTQQAPLGGQVPLPPVQTAPPQPRLEAVPVHPQVDIEQAYMDVARQREAMEQLTRAKEVQRIGLPLFLGMGSALLKAPPWAQAALTAAGVAYNQLVGVEETPKEAPWFPVVIQLLGDLGTRGAGEGFTAVAGALVQRPTSRIGGTVRRLDLEESIQGLKNTLKTLHLEDNQADLTARTTLVAAGDELAKDRDLLTRFQAATKRAQTAYSTRREQERALFAEEQGLARQQGRRLRGEYVQQQQTLAGQKTALLASLDPPTDAQINLAFAQLGPLGQGVVFDPTQVEAVKAGIRTVNERLAATMPGLQDSFRARLGKAAPIPEAPEPAASGLLGPSGQPLPAAPAAPAPPQQWTFAEWNTAREAVGELIGKLKDAAARGAVGAADRLYEAKQVYRSLYETINRAAQTMPAAAAVRDQLLAANRLWQHREGVEALTDLLDRAIVRNPTTGEVTGFQAARALEALDQDPTTTRWLQDAGQLGTARTFLTNARDLLAQVNQRAQAALAVAPGRRFRPTQELLDLGAELRSYEAREARQQAQVQRRERLFDVTKEAEAAQARTRAQALQTQKEALAGQEQALEALPPALQGPGVRTLFTAAGAGAIAQHVTGDPRVYVPVVLSVLAPRAMAWWIQTDGGRKYVLSLLNKSGGRLDFPKLAALATVFTRTAQPALTQTVFPAPQPQPAPTSP